jgi:hypothetical protein
MESNREKLANLQHDIWAHWMKYLFSVCQANGDGSYTIPSEKAQRWLRQISTPYQQLLESEKTSDREQADKILSNFHFKGRT